MANFDDYHATAGTREAPLDDIFLKGEGGVAQSVKELIAAAGGLVQQPFIVDDKGDVVMVARGNAGGTGGGSQTAGYLLASYVGNDEPGSGNNTLPNGYSRIWQRLDGKVFLVSCVSFRYFTVEATPVKDE